MSRHLTVEVTEKEWRSRQWEDGALSQRDLSVSLTRTFDGIDCQEVVTSAGYNGRRRLRLRPHPESTWDSLSGSAPDESIGERADIDAGLVPEYLDSVRRAVGVRRERISATVRVDDIATTFSSRGVVSLSRIEQHVFFGLRCVLPSGARVVASRHRSAFPTQVAPVVEDLLSELDARMRAVRAHSPLGVERLDVHLSGRVAGVFAHECVGHLLETDIKGSQLIDLLSQNMGTNSFSVVDDPAGAHFTSAWDDEGTPTESVTLVDEGTVSRLIADRARNGAGGFGRLTTNGIRPRMRNVVLSGTEVGNTSVGCPGSRYLVPEHPVRAGCNGSRFGIAFGAARLYDGGHPVDVGPVMVAGEVLTTLRSMRVESVPDGWLADGGMCGKGGGDPIYVGAAAPGITLRDVECTAYDLENLQRNRVRVEQR